MNNIDIQYQSILKEIIESGYQKGDRTGTGTISLFGKQIRHKMSEGFPLLTTKKMYFKGIVTELIWFLKGDTNIKYLIDNNCHIWDGDAYQSYKKLNKNNLHESNRPLSKEEFIEKIKTDDSFAKKWGELGPIYGKQWRRWNANTDQVKNLIEKLKTNPDDRRMIVTAWNPDEIEKAVLPPCHYGFQVYTRNLTVLERWSLCKNEVDVEDPLLNEKLDRLNIPKRELSLLWNQRSADFPLGIPFNIASYALLLELLSIEVNMVPGELIGNIGDCHIYLNQIEGIKEQIKRDPFKLPSILINKNLILGGLLNSLDNINSSDIVIENYEFHPSIKFELSN